MDPTPIPRPTLSATAAMGEAITLAGQRLFPFRLERWLPLGFVAFLDTCGRGGLRGSYQFPGGGGGPWERGPRHGGALDPSVVRDWISAHLAVLTAIALAGLLIIVTLMAIVAFLHSRGVFMYVDNVASGRYDVVRPWHEHAQRAWSYFAWRFGLGLAGLVGFLVLLVPAVSLVLSLVTAGPSVGAIVGLLGIVLVFIAYIVALGLFSLLLRDFAAPLQIALDLPCGAALRVAWGLVTAHLGTFLAYVALKIAFIFVAAIVAFVAGCVTCCIGFLPVIAQTILQPFLYFERAWSLFLLRQAGYDLFAPPAPPV